MTIQQRRELFVIGATFVIIVLLGYVGNMDYKDAKDAEKDYCDNVSLWNRTHGTAGWPDFNNNYSEVCK